MKKNEKEILWKKKKILKSLWSKGLTHRILAKSETNFFFVSNGGPFGVFGIFKVSLCIRWSTLMDRNGGSDFLDCWNCGIKGCLNIKEIIW